jgi:hypothetical protein
MAPSPIIATQWFLRPYRCHQQPPFYRPTLSTAKGDARTGCHVHHMCSCFCCWYTTCFDLTIQHADCHACCTKSKWALHPDNLCWLHTLKSLATAIPSAAEMEVELWPAPNGSYSLSERLVKPDMPPVCLMVGILDLLPVKILCG